MRNQNISRQPVSGSLRRTAVAIAVTSALASGAATYAADFTWNGGAGDSLWSSGTNWNGGVAPAFDSSGNTLIFGTVNPSLNPLIDNAYTVGRINFQATAGYNVGLGSGGSLVIPGVAGTFTTGIFSSVPAANGSGVNSTLGASFASTTGLVYVDSSVAAGTITLSGDITSSGSGTNSQGQTYGFGKIGTGRLILSGTNSFANGFEARNGVVGLASNGAAGQAGQTFGISTGNTVTLYNPNTTPVSVASNLVLGEANTATIKTTNFGLFTAQLTTYGLTAAQQGDLIFNGSVSQVSSNPTSQQIRLDVRTGTTTTFNGVVTGNRYNKVGGGTLIFGENSDASGVSVFDSVAGVTVVSNSNGLGQSLYHGSVDGQASNLAVPTGSSVTLSIPATFTSVNPTTLKAIVLGAPGYTGSLTLAGPVTLTGLNTVAGSDTSVKPIGVSDGVAATISGVINSDGGAFGITKYGNGSLTLSGINQYTGFTGLTGGVLNISDNRNLGGVAGGLQLTGGTLVTTANVTSARQIVTHSTIPANAAPTYVPNKATIDTGAFNSTFGPVLLSGTATTGELVKLGSGSLTVTRSEVTNLTINEGTLRFSEKVTPNLASGVSRIVSLHVGATAALDVTNNAVVINSVGREAVVPVPGSPGTPGSPAVAGTSLEAVRELLRTGYASGAWNGPGIHSSVAAATSRGDAIGYAAAADVAGTFATTFPDIALDASSIVLVFTIAGDSNLDLVVDFDDLLALAQNYGTATGGAYTTGDFTYDGAVNFSDLLLLAQNYNVSLAQVASIEGASADFFADWTLAQSMVPEPTTLLALCAPLLLSKRRRMD